MTARKTHVHLSDLAGFNQLATGITAEVTDLAEALHNNIACSPGIGWVTTWLEPATRSRALCDCAATANH